jgi:cell division protein FtsB
MGIVDLFQISGYDGLWVVVIALAGYFVLNFGTVWFKQRNIDQRKGERDSVDLQKLQSEVAEQIRAELHDEVTKLRTEVKVLKDEVDSWRDKYASLNAAHELLSQQHSGIKQENIRLRRENKVLRDFIFNIKDAINADLMKELLDKIQPISE